MTELGCVLRRFRRLGLGVLVLAATVGAPARAQDLGEVRTAGQRNVGMMLHVGVLSGVGGGLQVGSREVGLRASVAWSPLVVATTRAFSESDLNFYGGLLLAPDVYFRVLRAGPTTDIGAQLGYRYSSLLGHGVGAGCYVQFAIGRSLDAVVSGGVLVFPDGEDQLRREEQLPATTGFGFPGPSVNFGLSLGIVLFP